MSCYTDQTILHAYYLNLFINHKQTVKHEEKITLIIFLADAYFSQFDGAAENDLRESY